jgi:hypothetical protein
MGRRRRITAGAIQDLELAEIIQIISLGRKTARVTVKATDDEGDVWFLQGEAVHASTSDLSGTAAFYRILEWRIGRFFIEHESTCGLRTIDTDTTLLLMESLQLRDERDERSADREHEHSDAGTMMRRPRGYRVVVGVAVATTFLLGGIVVVSLIDAMPTDGSQVEAVSIARIPASGMNPSPPLELTRTVALEAPDIVDDDEPLTIAPGEVTSIDPVHRPQEDGPGASPPSASPELEESVAVNPPIEFHLPESKNELPEMEEFDSADAQVSTEPEPGNLRLLTRSLVNGGTLVVLVDGEEVYRRDLVHEERGVKWLFKRATGRAVYEFEHEITLSAGSHELVARLVRPNKPDRESAINLKLESAGVEVMQLLLGRSTKKGIVWSPGQKPPDYEPRTEERSTVEPDSMESDTSSAIPYDPAAQKDALSDLVEGTQ